MTETCAICAREKGTPSTLSKNGLCWGEGHNSELVEECLRIGWQREKAAREAAEKELAQQKVLAELIRDISGELAEGPLKAVEKVIAEHDAMAIEEARVLIGERDNFAQQARDWQALANEQEGRAIAAESALVEATRRAAQAEHQLAGSGAVALQLLKEARVEARRKALEEAAQIVEDEFCTGWPSPDPGVPRCLDRIRALATEDTPPVDNEHVAPGCERFDEATIRSSRPHMSAGSEKHAQPEDTPGAATDQGALRAAALDTVRIHALENGIPEAHYSSEQSTAGASENPPAAPREEET